MAKLWEVTKLVRSKNAGPFMLTFDIMFDDPETYAEPWTVAFPYKRDNSYQQFEYACHEGNWAVPNSLNGARVEESAAR